MRNIVIFISHIFTDILKTHSRIQICSQNWIGEKSQWKWLWISWGLSYSILTQGGTGGLSGEAGLVCEDGREAALVGVISAWRRGGRRVDTGGRALVVVVVVQLPVWGWVCDEPWQLACEGAWSPTVKNEKGGRVEEEGGWRSRAPPKVAVKVGGHGARCWMAGWLYMLPQGYDWYAVIPP